MEYNPVYRNYSIEQFQPADLEKLSAVDIEEYMDYLKVYKSDDDALRTNGEKGLARKMSALRSFYGYYYKHQVITQNPTLLVDMPKQHEKRLYDWTWMKLHCSWITSNLRVLRCLDRLLSTMEKPGTGTWQFSLYFLEPVFVYRNVLVWILPM